MRGTPGNPQVDRLNYLIALFAGSGTSGGRQTWSYPAFFVDPSNVTGTASDSNSGLSPSLAILTTAELNKRLFLKTVVVAATIKYLSDDPTGTLLDLSGVSCASTGSLAFQGTPQVTHSGGTLNGGTIGIDPTAPGGGQRQTGHTSDLAAFAPFVLPLFGGAAAHPEYIVIVGGPNDGTSAWIVSGVGATASLSRPMDSTFFGNGTFTIGDSYRIQRGSTLAVSGDIIVPFANLVTFTDFAFTNLGVTMPGSEVPLFNRCSSDAIAIASGVYSHCFLADDISFADTSGYLLNAGVWVLTGGNTGDTVIEVINDTYATSASNAPFAAIVCNSNGNGNLAILVGNAPQSGIQLQDFQGSLAAMIIGDAPPLCTGQNGASLIWGNGNLGRGIVLAPNAGATVPAGVGVVPSVTGLLGDYAFLAQNGGAIDANGRPWDEVGDAYGASAATSWANFVGGAFNFQCHHPATNAHIVGI